MRDISGKTVLLTGAASGIGRELAFQLADAGCHLLLIDRDEEGLQQVADAALSRNVAVRTYACDLSRAENVDGTLDAILRDVDVIDILINNAGVAYYGPTQEMTQQQWDWLLSINLLAPIRITQRLLSHLLERPDSHIVNMCSISGLVAGGRFSAYHTSKFGLVGYTEALRAEFGRCGLGVTAMCPGPVKTKLYQDAAKPENGRDVPTPPSIICASPARVASLTIKAIRRNRRMVLVTPLAHGLYQAKRFIPGVLDFVSRLSRSEKKRRQERLLREEQRLLALQQSAADTDTLPADGSHPRKDVA